MDNSKFGSAMLEARQTVILIASLVDRWERLCGWTRLSPGTPTTLRQRCIALTFQTINSAPDERTTFVREM